MKQLLPVDISGKLLHTQLIKRGYSLRDAAKALGISPEEMKSYFEKENFDLSQLDEIFSKLSLVSITEGFENLTPENKKRELISFINIMADSIHSMDKIINSMYELIKILIPDGISQKIYSAETIAAMDEKIKMYSKA